MDPSGLALGREAPSSGYISHACGMAPAMELTVSTNNRGLPVMFQVGSGVTAGVGVRVDSMGFQMRAKGVGLHTRAMHILS